MDEIVAATVDMAKVESWQAGTEVSDVRRVLGREGFEEMLTDERRLRRLPGPKSTLTAEQVRQLEEMGVIRARRRTENAVRHVCKAFTVPKPNGKNRLIVDASVYGEAMQEPPQVKLPAVKDVKEAVAKNAYVAQLDGRSWFFQIAAPQLQDYFVIRTVVGVFQLVVLAMGWAWSVYVAQTTASVIMTQAMKAFVGHASGMVYIDNFLIFGADARTVTNAVAVLKRKAGECRAVFKEEDHQPAEQTDVLGMRVDLAAKTVCLVRGFIGKLAVFWRVYKADPATQTLKTTWKLLGALFWAMRVLNVPQYDYPSLKQFVSRRARELAAQKRGWTHRTVWWRRAWLDVVKLVQHVLANEPVSVLRPPSDWIDTVWADASKTGGGYVLQETGEVKGWKWTPEQQRQPIHVLEAWATLRSVRRWMATREGSAGVLLKTDNALVYYALTTTKATGYVFSQAIAAIVSELRGVDWSVEWVPTDTNLADAPSRIFS
ncbi:Gag-Pol polyprotein [Diplonema papillatum]|nr:Gag-Pol polyprotein [Diplonema papillatum]